MARWNKHSIRRVMSGNFAQCRKMLVALYNQQTADEKDVSRTKHDNDRGFNQPDAPEGMRLARKAMTPQLFEPWEVIAARKLLWKYAAQLARLANAKAEREAAARQPVGV